MSHGGIAASLVAVLVCTASAFANVIPFDYPLTQKDVVQTAWVKIYKGNGTDGPLALTMSCSLPGHGYIKGSVNCSGNTVTSIKISPMYVEADQDLYLDGYIGRTHVEFRLNDFRWTSAGTLGYDIPVDPVTGDFGRRNTHADVLMPTTMSFTLGDLITYDVPPNSPSVPYDLGGDYAGKVTMVGNQLRVQNAFSGVYWEYLGSVIPNLNYSVQVGYYLDPVVVPEPATLSVLALGGLALLRRRRA
jgi:hypothetical protein